MKNNNLEQIVNSDYLEKAKTADKVSAGASILTGFVYGLCDSTALGMQKEIVYALAYSTPLTSGVYMYNLKRNQETHEKTSQRTRSISVPATEGIKNGGLMYVLTFAGYALGRGFGELVK